MVQSIIIGVHFAPVDFLVHDIRNQQNGVGRFLFAAARLFQRKHKGLRLIREAAVFRGNLPELFPIGIRIGIIRDPDVQERIKVFICRDRFPVGGADLPAGSGLDMRTSPPVTTSRSWAV